MTAKQRLYYKLYMRAYRRNGPKYGPRRQRRPAPPAVRRSLPPRELRDGHCVFCGLRALGDVCGFCTQEIAA